MAFASICSYLRGLSQLAAKAHGGLSGTTTATAENNTRGGKVGESDEKGNVYAGRRGLDQWRFGRRG